MIRFKMKQMFSKTKSLEEIIRTLRDELEVYEDKNRDLRIEIERLKEQEGGI